MASNEINTEPSKNAKKLLNQGMKDAWTSAIGKKIKESFKLPKQTQQTLGSKIPAPKK
jgi:hypothetical protein